MKKAIITLILLPIWFGSAAAQLQSDVSDSLWAIVMPVTETKDVDMGKCFVGSTKDSVVKPYVQNTGSYLFRVDSIYFTGTDASAFSLVSGFPKYSLYSGESNPAEFRFSPARTGIHEAQIVVITQADTLIRRITGVGVQPRLLVLEDIIDFGKVSLGKYKDTMQAVTIKNIGNAPLEITGTKHGKPNDADFSTLAGGGHFTLQPGDTSKMNLRFKPSSFGLTEGTLEFHYNDFGSPAVVQLLGEGYTTRPQINTTLAVMDDIICESSSQSTLTLANSGDETLVVSEINITGADKDDYSLSKPAPINIDPNNSTDITVTFTPQSPGQKTASIEIVSNSSQDSSISIALSSRKDSVALVPLQTAADLGYICLEAATDTVLRIANSGTVRAGGYAVLSSGIQSSVTGFVLDPAETFALPIHLPGRTAEGAFSETVSVVDSICGYKREVTITGFVASPSLTAAAITIKSYLGTTSTGTMTLKNLSKRELTIATAPPVAPPFSIVGNPFPLTLPVNGTADITIAYTPVDLKQYDVVLHFDITPCAVNDSVSIAGIPYSARVTLKIPEVEAYPGDIITVPVIMENQQNLALSNITGLQADLAFNSTLLAPLDYQSQTKSKDTAYITFRGMASDTAAGTHIANVRFVAGLGNSTDCGLLLSNVVTDGGTADIYTVNGRFSLLGLCDKGGIRLVNTLGNAGIVSIRPNPANSSADIGLELTEAGQTKLCVSDILGNEVRTLFNGTVCEFGMRIVSADLSGLPAGVYFIVLQTPTVRKSGMVIKS